MVSFLRPKAVSGADFLSWAVKDILACGFKIFMGWQMVFNSDLLWLKN
jgi:hypothetical protein